LKIIFSSNVAWSIYNFRKDLLLSLQGDGHDIYCVSNDEEGYSSKLEEFGFEFHQINVENNSKNPIKDLLIVREYFKLYKNIKPDVILHNAIKPNIYGTIAAGLLKIKVINNISGLGTLFIKKSISTYLAKFLYLISQSFATTVFFQNKYDMQLFIKSKLVNNKKSKLIPGSGVDTSKFIPLIEKREDNQIFDFLFVGRLLKDKGIMELFNATNILNEEGYKFNLTLLGELYENNETSISKDQLEEWTRNSYINYVGATDDVTTFMQKADCLVLPSYREGLSKVLIEASSIELPIVTTDVPGCKDVVIDEYNGLLCEVRNSNDLADKMKKMMNYDKKKRLELGKNGRKIAKEKFDVNIIIDIYKREINKIV